MPKVPCYAIHVHIYFGVNPTVSNRACSLVRVPRLLAFVPNLRYDPQHVGQSTTVLAFVHFFKKGVKTKTDNFRKRLVCTPLHKADFTDAS